MLRLKNLSNKYQKRLIRPLYANTQATPYAANLDPSFRATDGTIRVPLSGDVAGGATNPLSVNRTANVFTLKNSIIPGLIMVKAAGENVAVASGGNVAEQPFGLLANFVGGDLDDGFGGDSLLNSVGVWRGPDAVFELLAPAFDDTNLASSATTNGLATKLYAQADGRLGVTSPGGNAIVVAHLIERTSASRITVDLKI